MGKSLVLNNINEIYKIKTKKPIKIELHIVNIKIINEIRKANIHEVRLDQAISSLVLLIIFNNIKSPLLSVKRLFLDFRDYYQSKGFKLKLQEFSLNFLDKFPNLTTLSLYQSNVYKIPFLTCPLERLNLMNNPLIDLTNIFNFTTLKKLHLGKTNEYNEEVIMNVPDKFHLLPNLEDLRVNDCNITTIKSIKNHQNIQILDLNNLWIKDIQFNCPNLRSVSLTNNCLEKLPTFSHPHIIESLEICGNEIEEIPNEIEKFTNLRLFTINGNFIEFIPKELEKCKKLRVLEAKDNKIMSVKVNFKKLAKLKKIDLGNNLLTTFPKKIHRYSRTVYLDNNKIRKIPDEFEKSHIINLNLESNLLSTIPTSLINNSFIRKLNLKNNRIKELPINLSSNNSLVSINLTENIFLEKVIKKKYLKSWYFLKTKLNAIYKIRYKKLVRNIEKIYDNWRQRDPANRITIYL